MCLAVRLEIDTVDYAWVILAFIISVVQELIVSIYLIVDTPRLLKKPT